MLFQNVSSLPASVLCYVYRVSLRPKPTCKYSNPLNHLYLFLQARCIVLSYKEYGSTTFVVSFDIQSNKIIPNRGTSK